MSDYTYYKPDTGEIVGTISGSQDQGLAALYSSINGVYPGNLYYVSNGQAVPKTPFSVTVEGEVISGIPEGTTALIDGAPTAVSGGVLSITPIPNHRTQVVLLNVKNFTEELLV